MRLFLSALLAAAAAAISITHSTAPVPLGPVPGYDDSKPLNFEHYAGHIALANDQKMFYWLVEAEENSARAPLVLWLNGGPGCSSISGMFTENGPFVVQSDLSVRRNPYAWNRHANVLYLESPAGVGFSSPVLDKAEYTDAITAARAAEFLMRFLKAHPRYENREFYVMGESYAGMYIPWLVDLLVTTPLPGLRLKGMAIGNAFTDQDIDNESYIDYYYSHGLISMEAYHAIQTSCVGELARCMYDIPINCSEKCSAAVDHSVKAIATDTMDPYYIYGDVCLMASGQSLALPHTKHKKALNTTTAARNMPQPCIDTFTNAYLQTPELRAYLNITDNVVWEPCSDAVGDLYESSTTVLPKYKNILAANLSVLIYSGDADAVVDFIGTQRWIGSLNLSITDEWHAWYGPDLQLAGYTQGYDGLTFTTVKGAGHMVPAVRPLHGLYMFECYLFGAAKCKALGYPLDPAEVATGFISAATLTANLFAKGPSAPSVAFLLVIVAVGRGDTVATK
uniref:Carboxypeptidase n=1 Tax=Achlya hypogyna TaxID=1202772 RepID=A0A0A7CMS5_ACHHY|nr:secreted protein [Achlya hypogyna]